MKQVQGVTALSQDPGRPFSVNKNGKGITLRGAVGVDLANTPTRQNKKKI